MRICKRCKQIFTPLREYHQLCWTCWHAEQSAREPDALTDEAAWRLYQAGYRQGWEDGRREGEMPPAIHRGLLRLCHPDGHSGSILEPLAHELTVWLLSHRPDPSTVERN